MLIWYYSLTIKHLRYSFQLVGVEYLTAQIIKLNDIKLCLIFLVQLDSYAKIKLCRLQATARCVLLGLGLLMSLPVQRLDLVCYNPYLKHHFQQRKNNYQNTKTETRGESSLDTRVSLSLLREARHGELKSIKPAIDLSF